MKKYVFFVIFFLLALSVRAQEEAPQYRLRVPTQDEYVSTISNLEIAIVEPQLALALDYAILGEFEYRFPDLFASDYRTLRRIYEALNLGYLWAAGTRQTWNIAMLNAALRENAIDLTSTNSVSFEDYSIEITPVDFDADGISEYILDVLKNPSTAYDAQAEGEYQAYLVAVQNDQGYHILPLPLPWNGEPAAHWTIDHLTPRRFEDVNGDGKPEWLVDGWRSNTGPGAVPSVSFYVIGWRDGIPVSLLPEGSLSALTYTRGDDVSWEFDNIDNDTALELIQTSRHSDNWSCTFSTVSAAQWDDSQMLYVMGEEEYHFDDVPGCVWRRAEDAMWARDYAQAAELYATYLSFDTSSEYRDAEDRQYIRLRMAIALAFLDRLEETITLLEELSREPAVTPDMGELIASAYAAYNSQDEIALCTATYNFFTRYQGNAFYAGPIDRYIGQTLIDTQMFIYNTSPASAAYAGCNIPVIIDRLFPENVISATISPPEQVRRAGIAVDGAFQTDFNGDEEVDWMVWLAARVAPIVFVRQGETYAVSRMSSTASYSSISLTSVELPDERGNALALLNEDVSSIAGYFSCVDSTGQYFTPPREFELWRLGDNGLYPFFYAVLCESVDFEDILQNDNRQLNAWMAVDEGYLGGTVHPSVFVWDAQQQNYVLSMVDGEPYVRSVSEIDSWAEPEATIGTAIILYQSALIFHNAEVSEALATFDLVMTNTETNTSPDTLAQARYCYGILLESVGRTDEALAQYVAIYSAAPESAWGQLAALHLERVE
ncbi:MAG: hypothetical protein U0694_24090 [Anaerolineae bacterium]